jgi:hypothetical protein
MDGDTIFGLVWLGMAAIILAIGLVWQGYDGKELGGSDTLLLFVCGFAWPAFLVVGVIAGPFLCIGWLLHRLGRLLKGSA